MTNDNDNQNSGPQPASQPNRADPAREPTRSESESARMPVIVAIGASAGGIHALQNFFAALPDGTGAAFGSVWLSGRARARDHGEAGARELMGGREPQTRSWCLDVYESDDLIFAIPFASVDPTLDHLGPTLRSTVEASNESIRSLRKTVAAARATMRESRALVALSRGKPYLAVERGEPTIRSIKPAPPGRSRRR